MRKYHLNYLVACLIFLLSLGVHGRAQSLNEINSQIRDLETQENAIQNEIEAFTEVLDKIQKNDLVFCGTMTNIVTRSECSAWITRMLADGKLTPGQARNNAAITGRMTRALRDALSEVIRQNEKVLERIKNNLSALLDERTRLRNSNTGANTNTSTIGGKGQAYEPTIAGYTRGSFLKDAVLPGNKSTATPVGIVLEKGKAYFIEGEGEVSLWEEQEDGCDSVFRYKAPRTPDGGPKVVWGQLLLFNPNIHLSELIERQLDRKLTESDYRGDHVYQALVIGDGLPLKAMVFDGNSYSDNHGKLTIKVYDAIKKR